jgi:predicted nucleic acid-binding protein
MTVVLDSWAILRYLEDDGWAADAVASLLASERPVMSWINLGEVYYVVRRREGGDSAAETVRDLRQVLDAELPNADRVLEAARIKADHPLAYADAFAAATASAHDAVLWTGDPELLLDGAPWRWHDLRQPGSP